MLGGLLALFSLYFISMNLGCVYLGLIRRERHSLGPLLGGGAGSLAMLLLPLPELRSWAWVPLAVDPGCLYAALALVYALITARSRAQSARRPSEAP
jgi:hypothetical protein